MQTIDNINDYWGAPVVNWFDYFVDMRKFTQLLDDPVKNKEVIGRLAIQFAEQATNSDKEGEMLIAKTFAQEDVQFSQRKSACLWLHAMSSLAAINWDFDYLIDKFGEILLVRVLMEYVLKVFRNNDLSVYPSFGDWLYARWVLSVDRRYRIPPPPAKPTVSNPLSMNDTNLNKHENIRKMVIETRERLQSTVFTMEKIVTDGRGLDVPRVSCFLQPFIRSGGMALSIAIVGASVLCDGPPVPDLSLDFIHLPATDVINRTRLDLVAYYLANGNMLAAKNLLTLITSPPVDSPLTSIDLKVLVGYCIALGIPPPFPVQRPSSREMIPDQKLLADDSSLHRRLLMRRWRAERETTGQLQVAFRSENIARNVIDGLPITSREKLTEKVVTERFVKSLLRQFPNVLNEKNRLRIDALLLFLCATVPGIREELIRNGVDENRLRPVATATVKTTTPPPGTPILKALLKPENHFWTVITSFNAQEIKSALSTLEHFVLPYGFKFPELLGEAILVTRPVNEYHAILLGKLQQLGRMKNKIEWDASANSYATEIGQLAVANKKRILLEAIKVQTCIMNSRILVAQESMDAQVFDLHMRTVKGVFNDPSVVNTSNSSQLITQVLAFALNAGEWDFVLGKIESNHTVSMASKLLAAYGQRCAQPGSSLRKLAEAWASLVSPLFDNGTKRRNDGSLLRDRDITRSRVEMVQLFRLIRHTNLLALLISHLCFTFNRSLLADRKPQLRLFVQHSDYFGSESELSHAHHEVIGECLNTVFRNALQSDPTNAFWLRAAADYNYAKGELDEASILYMETLIACRNNLSAPFPDNVVDDTVWSRLRVCLSRARCYMLSALVCQLIRNKKDDEYMKAYELLVSQQTLDAGSECSSMIFDHVLAEYISDAYEKNNQHACADRLMSWVSCPCMNPNNRIDVFTREQSRRAERLLRTIAAYVFAVHL